MRKQLAQVNISVGGTSENLYTPGTNLGARNLLLYISEHGGASATWDLFHDDNGTSRTDTESLYTGASLAANETKVITLNIDMDNSTGSLGVEASTADVTFTLYGNEYAP